MDGRNEKASAERLKKYVPIKGGLLGMDVEGVKHVFFEVEHQSFCLTQSGCESEGEAEFWQKSMLAALANMMRLEAAEAAKKPATEYAWLIETASEAGDPIYWGSPDCDDICEWTTDPHKAIRFSRMRDAASIIAANGWRHATAVEHGFG